MGFCECCGHEKRSWCATHGEWVRDGEKCVGCDLCAHGKRRTQDCRECHANDDESWRAAPVSDAEVERLASYLRGYNGVPVLRRETPHTLRNFVESYVDLGAMIVNDYRRLRRLEAHRGGVQ